VAGSSGAGRNVTELLAGAAVLLVAAHTMTILLPDTMATDKVANLATKTAPTVLATAAVAVNQI